MNPFSNLRLFFMLSLLISALPLQSAESDTSAGEPAVITPGLNGQPPSDALVLFDGRNLNAWLNGDQPAQWNLIPEASAMEVKPGSGPIRTKASFGDVQLHIEWASPREVKGDGQGRGNSGVYLQGRYEIQVLDSYQNKTYFDGQAGAFYGNAAPLVNASRPPGEWQTYDIVFVAPKPQDDGSVQPGSFTVFHNGVLIQHQTPIKGDATTAAAFQGVTPKGPLVLQDHGNPVRFRNIWIRELK